MHAQARQRAELKEIAAAVEQARDALARQQLAALVKLVALGRGLGEHLAFQSAHLRELFLHALHIGLEGSAARIEAGSQARHYFSTSGVTAR